MQAVKANCPWCQKERRFIVNQDHNYAWCSTCNLSACGTSLVHVRTLLKSW